MSIRVWFARDTGYTADPKVQVLGDDHGPGGPLALEELMALAKLADRAGEVTITYATLARRTFITPGKAKQIIDDAAELELIIVSEQDKRGFTATFPRWSRWQPKDPGAAARQSRRRHALVTEDVTP